MQERDLSSSGQEQSEPRERILLRSMRSATECSSRFTPDEVLSVVFTYNRPAYLHNLCNSFRVCAPEFRLLIIDDGSTDVRQIELLDFLRGEDGVDVMEADGANQRHGGLYLNMNEALRLAGDRGYRFMNMLQDDMQLVRPATDDILYACEILDTIQRGIHMSLVFRKYLDVKNEPKPCDFANVYRSQNLQICDTGLVHVERAIESGFSFQESERAHSALAVELGFEGYVYRDPVVGFVPWPEYFRSRKAFGERYRANIGEVRSIKFMLPEEVEHLKARDVASLPYMEDWCRPVRGGWLKPFNYTSSKVEWVRRVVSSLIFNVGFRRYLPGVVSHRTICKVNKKRSTGNAHEMREVKLLYLSYASVESRAANSVQQISMYYAFSSACGRITAYFLSEAAIYRARSYSFVKAVDNSVIRFIPKTASWRLGSAIYCLRASCEAKKGHYDFAFTRSPVFAKSILGTGLDLILEMHAVPAKGTADWENTLFVWKHPNLRRIVSISQVLADDLVIALGAPNPFCDIVVAHDGADAGPRPGPALLHELPLKVGYFGHLYPGKGMEIIASIAPSLPNMNFEVYGGTEEDISNWRGKCKRQDNLIIHGHIAHQDVRAKMAACDILIAPYAEQVSHIGNGDIGRWMSPLKLFEYMAAERPVITSDIPVLREVVRDGETAILCRPGDKKDFVKALRRLAADPEMRARIGSAGRDLLEAEYTWNIRAVKILDGLVTGSCKQ